MSGLNVRKDACELDFLALGALVHRLDPGVIPFRKARSSTSTSPAASTTSPRTCRTASA